MEQIPVRATAEVKSLIEKAAESVGLSVSSFMRFAAIEKSRAVLGMEPKLPIYTEGSRDEPKRK